MEDLSKLDMGPDHSLAAIRSRRSRCGSSQGKADRGETSLAAEKSAQYAAHVERSRHGCGWWSRSSPTAARKPPLRSRHCGTPRIAAGTKVAMNQYRILIARHHPCHRHGRQHLQGALRLRPPPSPRIERRRHAERRSRTRALREEVKQLKERLHVLERIAVDKENSLGAPDRRAARPLARAR